VIDQFAVPAPPTGPLFGVIFKVIQFVYQLLIVIELVIQTFVNNREKLGDPFYPFTLGTKYQIPRKVPY
jgi:hypothetical protein